MWFQSPAYLKWSRMHLLSSGNQQMILSYIDIQGGDRVLDVGCGTGEFTRYIAQRSDCTYLGVDIEDSFIEIAKEQERENLSFQKADALALPFADDSFDVVVSHTFFTGISDPHRAMLEMRRVCKPHGKIISITAESFQAIAYDQGQYPDFPWLEEYRLLKRKLDSKFFALSREFVKGIQPEKIPAFFSNFGLQNVCVYQIGKFFSLSNGTISQREREAYLECEYQAECSRMYLLCKEDRVRYQQLLEQRKETLRVPENQIWDWSGGSNLLIIGTNCP